MADAATTGWTAVQIITLVGGSSVIAALITQGVSWVREWLGETKEGKFTALYIAIALEEYARTTATILMESEQHDNSDGHAGTAHGNLAELPEYPEVNWRAFGIKRAEAAMTFRTDVDAQRTYMTGLWDVADEDDAVPEFQERAAEMGLTALALAEQFRKDHRLTPLDQSDEWSTKNGLARRHEKFVARRVKAAERQEASRMEMAATGSVGVL
jgi:hypothetical protein